MGIAEKSISTGNAGCGVEPLSTIDLEIFKEWNQTILS